jgi:low affinity Fe/Cu permease
MTVWLAILITIVIFLLPSIIFKFVDTKKLGEKIDKATQKMNERTEELKAKK